MLVFLNIAFIFAALFNQITIPLNTKLACQISGILFFISLFSFAQKKEEEGSRKNFSFWTEKTPFETIKAVGKKVISSTPFVYNLQVEKPSEKFDFIKSLDFGRSFGLGTPATAIAYTEIRAEKDTQIVLEISHNDGLMAWVNGKEVYKSEGKKDFKAIPRERNIELMNSFPLSLKRGSNQLVIKSETFGENWLVYLQPKNATIEFSPVQNLSLGLSRINGIDRSVAELSNWLIIGPFPPGLSQKSGPETEMVIGKMYTGLNGSTTWTIPKTEVFTNVKNPHPLWGTLYNYNYHTAGLAWAMANLGKKSNEKAFVDFGFKYCDFMLDSKPMVDFQYDKLHGFRSVQHHMVHTPLLDFTAAPTLPYAYFICSGLEFNRKKEYENKVEEIKAYLKKEQVRLPDGTFTRETPEKLTTWVDDMFMGIPFLVHVALAAKTPAEKQDYLNQAAKQVIGFNKQVFDGKSNLYHHAAYSTRPSNIPFWSRANGWGIFATTLVLQNLPKNHPEYKPIQKTYQAHAKKLLSLQDSSGFWHQVLDDKSSYLETSGTAIFTMALARGINQGWLPKKDFSEAVLKGWKAIATQIDQNGDVYNICIGTMSSEDANYYKTRPLVKSDSHGLIGVFWAAMEVQEMLDAKK
jgi:unsaturated rhamnogalacturonyl hydrolase